MKSVKFLMLIGILMFAGCSGSTEDTAIRIAQMQSFANVAERALTAYDERITIAEATIVDIRDILADPDLGIPHREEMQAAIARGLAAKAKFEGAKVVALEQIRSIRATIAELESDGIQPGEDLIAFGKGVTDVGRSLPAPVGPLFILIGTLIGGIGEVRRRAAVKIARGVVASVDALLEWTPNIDNKAKYKTILKSKQRELGVRSGVKKLLGT